MNLNELNPEKCEFIGAFIGDGYMGAYGKRKNHFVIGFAGNKFLDEDYFLNYLKPLIKRNFKFTNPKIRYRKDENTIMLRIYSKKLYEFLENLGFKHGIKSKIVKIPIVIEKNDIFMRHTLRGIFDTDGCLFFDKRKLYKTPYPRITLQMTSHDLIDQIEKFLSKEFKLYVNKSKNKSKNYLDIYGHEQLEKFLKHVGFSNKRHISKIYASVAQR